MLPVLELLLLVCCTVPALSGPVPRNAEEPAAPAGVRPSAFNIEPSESSLLASAFAAASSVEAIDTCTTIPAPSTTISSIGQSTSVTSISAAAALPTTSLLSDLAHYAAESSATTSETIFSYAPQISEITTESVASQPTDHISTRRTTTLTDFTTVAAGYGQATGSAPIPPSTEDAASTTTSLYSYTSNQPVSSYPTDTMNEQSTSVSRDTSSTTASSIYTSLPAPYAVPANSSVAIGPSQYLPIFSLSATISRVSSVTSTVEVSATETSSTASQYGGNKEASTNSSPLVYGSITLTYATPSETSISINPTQYVSAYPTTSAEEITSHHRHHPSSTEFASASAVETSSVPVHPGPASSTIIVPSIYSYSVPMSTTSDNSHSSAPSDEFLSIVPIHPSSYAFKPAAEANDLIHASQHVDGEPMISTASATASSTSPGAVTTPPTNSEFTTMYITVTATNAGATTTDFVIASAY